MIYIVEDDASIRELEQYALQTNDYEVEGFADGRTFWAAVHSRLPDLVILDVMLPDEDGIAILSRLRQDAATRGVPVIMVTAKASEIDVVRGLDHGADDYITKPFGVLEFISRVKAVLRRSASEAPAAGGVLRFGDIVMNDLARTVTAGGEPVDMGADDYMTKPFGVMELISRVKALLRRSSDAKEEKSLTMGDLLLDNEKRMVYVGEEQVDLTFKEYSLLHYFLEHPGEVLARERIMKAVWDTDDLLESRTIDMHVRTLRQKLGNAGDVIRTVRKVGYKLDAEAGDETT